MARWTRILPTLAVSGLGLAATGYGGLYWSATPDMGTRAAGAAKARIEQSPQWDGSGFSNRLPQVDGSLAVMLGKELDPGPYPQQPTAALPRIERFELAPRKSCTSATHCITNPPSGSADADGH